MDCYFSELAASGDPPIAIEPGIAAHGGWPLEILWSTGIYFDPDLRSLVEGARGWDFVDIGAGYSPDEPDVRKFNVWAPKFDGRAGRPLFYKGASFWEQVTWGTVQAYGR